MRSRLGATALAARSAIARSAFALGPGEQSDLPAQFAELGRVRRDPRRCAGPTLAFHHLVEPRLGGVRIAVGTGQVMRQRLPFPLDGAVRRHGGGDAGFIQSAAEAVAPVRVHEGRDEDLRRDLFPFTGGPRHRRRRITRRRRHHDLPLVRGIGLASGCGIGLPARPLARLILRYVRAASAGASSSTVAQATEAALISPRAICRARSSALRAVSVATNTWALSRCRVSAT